MNNARYWTRVWAKGSLLLLVVGLLAGLDQWSKIYMRQYLSLKGIQPIASFVRFVGVWNSGVSFGFSAYPLWWWRYILLIITICIMGILIHWYWRSSEWFATAGLLLILGGALGNAWDRFYFGAVFDFIHFYYKSWTFPVFNVADMLISVGFLILVSDYVLFRSRNARDF